MSEVDTPPGWSLERRISRHLLAVLGSLWLAGTAAALAGVWHETGEVLDSALNETAERFLVLPEIALGDVHGERLFAELGPHEEHVIYQVFDGNGQMRLRSHSAPDTPLDRSALDGIHDVNGWHILTLTRQDGRRRVEVAETTQHRLEVIWGSLAWLAGALLFVMPATYFALALVLRRGFRALEPTRIELASRDADDLRPVVSLQAPQELQPWLATVNALIDRLKVLIDAERSFAAHTAHELRTPLAAARAKAQRLAEVTTDVTARQHARALVGQLDRLTRLATRMLQLARMQSGARLQRAPVDLAVLANAVVGEFSDAVASERLRVEVAGASTSIVGDIDAIGIALRNLIDNALKHGGRQSWVTVLVEPQTIFVIDDGPGVPPVTLSRLIRPFERGITASEGSGLGLSITAAIVEQVGGTLDLRSPIAGGRGFAAVMHFGQRTKPSAR
jgi:two-component system OmpR family sensor kinase